MNKKIFAILMIIALILSSFTLAFADNSNGGNEKKDNSSNKKIHVHLETEQDDITKVEVIINGDTFELEANGKSGNYSVSKGGDLVSNKLTKIIVYTSGGKEEFEPAEDEQQGQEGQGSINYRINVTESDDETVENDLVEDETDGTGSTDGTSEEGTDIIGEEGTREGESDIEGSTSDTDEDTTENTDNTSPDTSDGTPSDDTPDTTESIDHPNNTITISTEETPLGLPEPQEIASNEESPVETEIEDIPSDEETTVEDEEIPLDLPSTGVATPLFYGAGALISLVGLLKRR